MVVLDMEGHDKDHQSRPRTSLFGIFDGHGGKEVARFAAAHIPSTIATTEAYTTGDMGKALIDAFLNLDLLLVKDENKAELKALKGSDDEEGEGGGDAGMTINSSQLPDALLEALGVSGDSGYVFKIVKSSNGQMRITGDGGDDEDEEEEEEEEGGSIVEIVAGGDGQPVEDAGVAAAGAGGVTAAVTVNGSADDLQSPFSDADADADGLNGNGKTRKRKSEMDVDSEQPGAEGSDNDPAAITDDAANDNAPKEMLIEELSGPREEEWHGPAAGCTAVCAMVRDGDLIVANAGDSRCVLSRSGQAVALTQDHKPMDPEEYDRIIKAGGFVADGRVNGSLNLSRALGDLEYKQSKDLPPEAQMVTAFPEIRREKLQPGADEFLILACDGIWDVLTNQEAVDFVRERLLQGKTPKQICEDACDHCLAPDTNGCGKGCDNMSIVISVFKGSQLAIQAAQARGQAPVS
jgi:serine/threonine protein phosphatase PrpC